MRSMRTPGRTGEWELVVAEDGSIPASQLARLGLLPSTHVRVVAAEEPAVAPFGLAGSLPELPDIGWDGFEQASELVRQDLTQTS